jgi:hypothetical protein
LAGVEQIDVNPRRFLACIAACVTAADGWANRDLDIGAH